VLKAGKLLNFRKAENSETAQCELFWYVSSARRR
jgi:hypothetical protein